MMVSSLHQQTGILHRPMPAQYAEIFASSHLFETPGAVLFGLAHKGSDLIGIIRVNRHISDEICQNIENDTKDILNSWI